MLRVGGKRRKPRVPYCDERPGAAYSRRDQGVCCRSLVSLGKPLVPHCEERPGAAHCRRDHGPRGHYTTGPTLFLHLLLGFFLRRLRPACSEIVARAFTILFVLRCLSRNYGRSPTPLQACLESEGTRQQICMSACPALEHLTKYSLFCGGILLGTFVRAGVLVRSW